MTRHAIETHAPAAYTPALLLKAFRMMQTIRRFEEKAAEFFLANKVPGMIHVSIGQEACAAGVVLALRPDDYVISTHRCHGHAVAKGANLGAMMAEILGRATGSNMGRGGSMHISDPAIGLLGANGIVGGGLPLGPGVGYSIQARGTDQVCVVFFGEGAANEGAFHESLNLASLWQLPVVYVCENNLYAELSHQRLHMRTSDVATRAAAYGMQGVVVDGTDVLAVLDATAAAADKARAGEGPTLVECKTYRWQGHFVGDPQTYRTKEEVQAWMAKDPVRALREFLVDHGIATAGDVDRITAEVDAEVDDAGRFALDSPLPESHTVLQHVYRG